MKVVQACLWWKSCHRQWHCYISLWGLHEFSEICYSESHIFNVQGSVHRKYIPIYIQQDATLHSLFISGDCSTYFAWYLHPKHV